MKFLIRLDDACPGMDISKWERITNILHANSVKPIIAVIPDDKYFSNQPYSDEFWAKIKQWRDFGWEIGLHGLNHLVQEIKPDQAKYLFFATKSEFCGHSVTEQGKILQKSLQIFHDNQIFPRLFIAPNHGFDNNTLTALKEYTKIRIISDGISLLPYIDNEILFIPQIDWKLSSQFLGIRTICLHPSTMSNKDIDIFENTLKRKIRKCVSLETVLKRKTTTRGVFDFSFATFFRLWFRAKNKLWDLIAK